MGILHQKVLFYPIEIGLSVVWTLNQVHFVGFHRFSRFLPIMMWLIRFKTTFSCLTSFKRINLGNASGFRILNQLNQIIEELFSRTGSFKSKKKSSKDVFKSTIVSFNLKLDVNFLK